MGFCTVWASAASTTSRGMLVRSAAQSRKLDRNPYGTAAMLSSLINWLSVASESGFPRGLGNTRPVPSLSLCTSCRIASAPLGERHAVIPLCLHARGGDGPDARVQVHFVPRRQAHLAGSSRRQHQELKRILDGDQRLGGSHGREGVRHRAVGQRPHVLDDGLLPSERLPEGVARRVVRPVAHCDRPLHHGTDPLAHPPCGLGLLVPDRGEDCLCLLFIHPRAPNLISLRSGCFRSQVLAAAA